VELETVSVPSSVITELTQFYDDNANTGTVTANADGTYSITVKTRPGAQTAIYFNGVWFMEQYSMVIDLPADSAVKPNRVYSFAARGTNETGADWSRAWDSNTEKPGVTSHSGGYTLSNGDTPLPTLRIDGSTQYKTVVLYLFWDNTVTGTEDYTFTLKSLKVKPYVYKAPPEAPFIVELQTYLSDDASPWGDTGTDSFKYPATEIDSNVPLGTDIAIDKTLSTGVGKWEYFNIQLSLPGAAVGKNYEFTVSNVGAYAGSAINLISGTPGFAKSWDLNETVTVTPQGSGVYKVKVSNIDADGTGAIINLNFTGFNGATNSGADITRYTITFNLPETFVP
jgi:hypothetical protein